MGPGDVTDGAVEAFYAQLQKDAERGGYKLNPDAKFVKMLVRGLLVNKGRYGYASCPCRLATGRKEDDLDIVCPCDYRDPDLNEHGACYCALYVSEAIAKGEKKAQPIPERRLPPVTPGGAAKAAKVAQAAVAAPATTAGKGFSLKYPVWRCKVCGYLCARDEPPGLCPVCKASNERFERFI